MTDGDARSPLEWLKWFWRTDHGAVVYVREITQSVGAVLLVGLVLFAVSGIWPPMVAVESGSMKPHMERGDLVFVMEEHRLAPEFAYAETGVVTYRIGQNHGYTKFELPGDVIIYRPNGKEGVTPIIHRAMFWVDAGENWYDEAVAVDPDAVGTADNCRELRNCPAEHAGFITKGDNDRTNQRYDQVSGLSEPVKPEWVIGTAEFLIPYLGHIRLWATSTVVVNGPVGAVGADAVGGIGPASGSLGAVAANSTADSHLQGAEPGAGDVTSGAGDSVRPRGASERFSRAALAGATAGPATNESAQSVNTENATACG